MVSARACNALLDASVRVLKTCSSKESRLIDERSPNPIFQHAGAEPRCCLVEYPKQGAFLGVVSFVAVYLSV